MWDPCNHLTIPRELVLPGGPHLRHGGVAVRAQLPARRPGRGGGGGEPLAVEREVAFTVDTPVSEPKNIDSEFTTFAPVE